jgi:hypothetical protein
MTRHKTDPLRRLTEEERGALEQLSRRDGCPRAPVLLAVAAGASYTAEQIGRCPKDAVAHLVARFNAEGERRRSPATEAECADVPVRRPATACSGAAPDPGSGAGWHRQLVAHQDAAGPATGAG